MTVDILSTSLGGLDLLASAVLVLDQQGRITYANAASESLLENSFKVLNQQRLSDLFLNGEKLALIFEQARNLTKNVKISFLSVWVGHRCRSISSSPFWMMLIIRS